MRWSVATAIVLSVSFLAGCEVLGGFEELTGRTGAAGTAGAAGESAAGAAGAASCEGQVLAGLKGAPPRGHLQRDGTCVYVDEREATEAEYAQFAAEESVENQTLVCPSSVNPSFAPAASCRVDPNPKADLPIVCVDQCDALAFCAWAGKSLCRGGTTPGQGDTSAWFEACSGNDTQDYPYAGPHQPGFCNDSTNAPAGGSGQRIRAPGRRKNRRAG